MSNERDFKLDEPLPNITEVYVLFEHREEGACEMMRVYKNEATADLECEKLNRSDNYSPYFVTAFDLIID